MKLLQKIMMIVSILFFLATLGTFLVTDRKILTVVFLVLHSLCLVVFSYLTISYKDPGTDSRRLSNLLQQSEAKYEEYRKDTELKIKNKDEIISDMSRELEEYKKGLR